MIYFSFPEALFLLILSPLFLLGAWMWQCRVARRMRRFSRHAPAYPKHARVQLILISIALLLGLFAFARPHWGKIDNPTQTYTIQNRNIMIAVDISRSMLAQDIQPNRLEYVKADILELLDKVGTDRVGLMAFKGEAEVLCPLTADKAFVKEHVNKLDTLLLPPGETNLAKPIQLAIETFKVAQTKQHLLLLISDGEALSGEALVAAKEAAELNLPIFTIGVGNPAGTVLAIDGNVVEWENEAVRTALDEATLKMIAEYSHGRYLPLATSSISKSSLETLYLHYLSQLESDETSTAIDLVYKERTWLFLFMSVIFFLIAAFLSLGRVSLARRKQMSLFLLFLCVGVVHAATPAREAQKAYEAGRFLEAIQNYEKALQEETTPEEFAQYTYNKAIAQWKHGDLQAALQSLDALLENPEYQIRATALRAQLMYEGEQQQLKLATPENPLPPQQRLQTRLEVVDAYTQALQFNPTDKMAKDNLARMMADIPILKNEVRRDEVMKRFEKDDFRSLIQTLLKKQRDLINSPPKQETTTPLATMIETSKTFATDVQSQADGWYYIAECANEKLDALLQTSAEQLSEEESRQREHVRQLILEEARKNYHTLDELVATYRALETSPEPLLPSEAIAYKMFQSFADVGGLLNETMDVRQCLVKGEMPLYHQSRPVRQEARQMEERIAKAVDQTLQTPPQHLKEEEIQNLKRLNEELKGSLKLEDLPAYDEEKLERLQQIQRLLIPPQQQDTQQQDSQNSQGQSSQDQNENQQQKDQQQTRNEETENQSTPQQQSEQEQLPEPQDLSEEEKEAAMKLAKEAEEELKEALKNQELNAILEAAQERTEALEKAKREHKMRQHSNRNLKDW